MKTYPKIGIRPTIDGRQGGIRESLEQKTMDLAVAVKNLIESNLRNGDGSCFNLRPSLIYNFYYSYFMLVLWFRNHGYESILSKGSMGI